MSGAHAGAGDVSRAQWVLDASGERVAAPASCSRHLLQPGGGGGGTAVAGGAGRHPDGEGHSPVWPE